MTLDDLCAAAVEAGASDVILHEGEPPAWRVAGRLVRVDSEPVARAVFDDVSGIAGTAADGRDGDAAFVTAAGERFRVSSFRHLGRRGAVLRHVRSDAPGLDDLGVPADLLRRWLGRDSGLMLVAGRAGAGKSTTLAACLAHINAVASRHVVTIEDPIEFVFARGTCVFTQREVGIDTESFGSGLRHSLRQSPDVIMVGEIRDAESAVATIQAAETGHLVLATMHGADAVEAIERMGQLLPGPDRALLGRVFANQLIGVLAQRLLAGTNGRLLPAVEYFENVGLTRALIEDGRFSDLRDHLERATDGGARSMMRSLEMLCRAGLVGEDAALAAVDRPADLARALRGISSATVRR